MITSLEVGLWPIISWSAQNIHRLHLVHLDTCVTHATPAGDLWCGPSGESTWGGMSPEGLVGVSWQWAQISPGVFALVDPMDVRSNLALLGSDGSRLSPTASAMVHNRIVATLGWQAEAARSLKSSRARRIDAVHVSPSSAARAS